MCSLPLCAALRLAPLSLAVAAALLRRFVSKVAIETGRPFAREIVANWPNLQPICELAKWAT